MIISIDDTDTIEQLKPEQWQLDVIATNNAYVGWGNGQDYMFEKDSGWSTSIRLAQTSELITLDDLNELINFYFLIDKNTVTCTTCDGLGTSITYKVYLDLLQNNKDAYNTIYQNYINKKQKNPWTSLSDLVLFSCEENGFNPNCLACKGYGYSYEEAPARLQLQMWFIHPRKGASKGVLLENIKQEELATVFNYLKEARKRFICKFSKVMALAKNIK